MVDVVVEVIGSAWCCVSPWDVLRVQASFSNQASEESVYRSSHDDGYD